MSHDGPLVALSFAVALFASYTALDMGSRLRGATGKARRLWLIGSAVVAVQLVAGGVVGCDVSAMHYAGGYVLKPVTKERLSAMIGRALSHVRSSKPAYRA